MAGIGSECASVKRQPGPTATWRAFPSWASPAPSVHVGAGARRQEGQADNNRGDDSIEDLLTELRNEFLFVVK